MVPEFSDIFLDRDDIFQYVNEALSDFQSDNSFFQIINVWGMGGIGKTSFLHKLKSKYSGGYWSPVFFSLELRKGKSLIDIILDLRNTLPFTAKSILRFDVAYIFYVAYLGGSNKKFEIPSDTLSDILGMVLLQDLSSAVNISMKVIYDAVDRIKSNHMRLNAEEFKALERAIDDGHSISIYKVFLDFLGSITNFM